jgi:divalent metal cation (Fe/Co/Zn/Cd) transporter
MKHIKAFGSFWWDFVVGDDWLAAAGVIVAIVATALLTHADINAWWLMPVAGVGVLYLTVRRATR